MLARYDLRQLRDARSGDPVLWLEGHRVQIVARDTTTPASVYEDAAGQVLVPESLMIVLRRIELPTFFYDPTLGPIDWWHPATGLRGPLSSEQELADAVAAMSTRVDEVADVTSRVASDAADLTILAASVLEQAQQATGGQGFVILDDPDAPPPPGTLPRTLIVTPLSDITPDSFTVMTGPGNVTTATGSSGATSDITLAIPSNTAVGDLLTLTVASQSGDLVEESWQAPAGWTLVETSATTPGVQPVGARHHATFERRVTDPATLASLGTQVTVGGGDIPGVSRRCAYLRRAIGAHADGVVGTSGPFGGVSNATTFKAPAFTSSQVAAGLECYIFCNTSSGTGQSDAQMTDAGWIKVARVVAEGVGGTPPAASELVGWWRPTLSASHPAASGTIDPPSAGGPVGLAFAVRGAA